MRKHVYACVCTIQNHVSEGHVSVKYALEHARCLEGINPSTRRSWNGHRKVITFLMFLTCNPAGLMAEAWPHPITSAFPKRTIREFLFIEALQTRRPELCQLNSHGMQVKVGVFVCTVRYFISFQAALNLPGVHTVNRTFLLDFQEIGCTWWAPSLQELPLCSKTLSCFRDTS